VVGRVEQLLHVSISYILSRTESPIIDQAFLVGQRQRLISIDQELVSLVKFVDFKLDVMGIFAGDA